jgi:hypothetical protein
MPQYPHDERVDRTKLSWNTYLDLESEMLDFLRYVPLVENHFEVFSPKLAALIFQVGPEVTNAFNLLAGNTDAYKKMDSMFEGGGALEKALNALWQEETNRKSARRPQSLSYNYYCVFLNQHGYNKPRNAKVKLIDNPSTVLNPFNEQCPNWWKIYNGLKHDKYENLGNATLFEALNSLGALFWSLDCCADELHIENLISSKLLQRVGKS